MLTRLEVDGFKNLRDVAIELGPFTCIAGPNGVGKSNLFDAIEFLSLLATHPIMEAAQRVRRSDAERSADPRDLFWTDGTRRAETMKFAAELIVPATVHDAFRREAEASITFLRYEIDLGYQAPTGLATRGHLVLRHESLRHIKLSDAHTRLRFPHKKREFRDRVLRGRRSGDAFISTVAAADGQLVTRIHQDGGSRGQPRPSPTELAPMTIVGTTTQASDPTILATKREFESWRMLALEPSAMRSPDRFRDPPRLDASGAHLAATLYRLATSGDPPDPEATYARIARRLADLLAVDSLRVERDDKLELLTLMLRLRQGPELPAKSISDGTLRFLALCLLEADPEATGLLCMEEPENGIHPARMSAMADLVRSIAVDPTRQPGPDNPMRQVLVNTHSPLFVQQQRADDLLLAVEVTARAAGGRPLRLTRFKPLAGTWRCHDDEPGTLRVTIADYLSDPDGAALHLFEEAAR